MVTSLYGAIANRFHVENWFMRYIAYYHRQLETVIAKYRFTKRSRDRLRPYFQMIYGEKFLDDTNLKNNNTKLKSQC